MKKHIKYYFAILLTVSLAACNTQEVPEKTESAEIETEEAVVVEEVEESEEVTEDMIDIEPAQNDEEYAAEKKETYDSQIEALGELPEGHVVVQDIDGTVSYVSEEEYNALLNEETRENTQAIEDQSASELMEDMEIEIVPADEDVWFNIAYLPIEEIDSESVYQSRGQFIYFAQKAIHTLFANQILATDFDTDTYTLEIVLNELASYPLPDDFEQRMEIAYKNSGYGTQAPDQLTIEYSEGSPYDYVE